MECRDADPQIFEEPVTSGRSRRYIDNRWTEAPLAYCKRCPVRERCLDAALKQPYDPSDQHHARLVVGGLTPNQVSELRRRRA